MGKPSKDKTKQKRNARRDEIRKTQAKSYGYNKLNPGFLRVLQLHPLRVSRDELSFGLIDLPFEDLEKRSWDADKVKYIAISYTWGGQKRNIDVACDGLPLKITENCRDILLSLRQEDEVVNVWIDQVCINQVDNRDKAENVRRMGEIYKGATAVFIWTGIWDETMEDHLSSYLLGYTGATRTWMREFLIKMFGTGKNIQSHPPKESLERNADLDRKFIEHPWFYRLWTLQEAILTPTAEVYFVVGRLLISVSKLAKSTRIRSPVLYSTLGRLLEAQKTFDSTFRMIEDRLSIENLEERRTIYSTIYDDARTRDCFLKQDRVYAVQSALQSAYLTWPTQGRVEWAGEMAVPDYERPFKEILIENAAYILGKQKELEFLTLALLSLEEQRQSKSLYTLPSWTPDLLQISTLQRYGGDGRSWPFHSVRFCLNFDGFLPEVMRIKTHATIDNSSKPILFLGGSLQGRIQSVSEEIPALGSRKLDAKLENIVMWEPKARDRLISWFKKTEKRSSPGAFVNDLGATLRYSSRENRESATDNRVYYVYDALARLETMDRTQLAKLVEGHHNRLTDRVKDYMDFIRDFALFEKSCFILKDGCHGIAFGAIKEGDWIVAVKGLDHGFLNYRNGEREGKAQFVKLEGTLTRLILRPVNEELQPNQTSNPAHLWRLVGKAIIPRLVPRADDKRSHSWQQFQVI